MCDDICNRVCANVIRVNLCRRYGSQEQFYTLVAMLRRVMLKYLERLIIFK